MPGAVVCGHVVGARLGSEVDAGAVGVDDGDGLGAEDAGSGCWVGTMVLGGRDGTGVVGSLFASVAIGSGATVCELTGLSDAGAAGVSVVPARSGKVPLPGLGPPVDAASSAARGSAQLR